MAFNEFDDGNTEGTNVNIVDSTDPSKKAKVDQQGNQHIKFGESSQLDAWGRIRVSLPSSLFELNFNFSDRPLNMYTATALGGTATYSYNKSGVDMQLPTTNGASVIRQTRRYFRYVTGKGITVLTANVCSLTKTNLTQQWGFFDTLNGMFFRYTSSGLATVIRTSTSGSPVETVINQTNWNLDKLDGSGESGVTVDPTKYNLWVIDFAWQGAGGVRFGLFVNGEVVYCHEYRPSNTLTVPFTRTPVLPIRFEIRNDGTTASTSTMYHGTLGVVIDESGSLRDSALQFSASRGASAKSIGTTLIPLLSIRPKLTFNGNVNRIPINVTDFSVTSETQIIYYQILKNATLTGDTFNSAGTNSGIEFDIASTSFTGGEKVSEGYVLASSQGSSRTLASDSSVLNKLNYLGLSIDGSVAENFVLVARTVTQTSDSYATIAWEEFQ